MAQDILEQAAQRRMRRANKPVVTDEDAIDTEINQCNGVDVKALISTTEPYTQINRKVTDRINLNSQMNDSGREIIGNTKLDFITKTVVTSLLISDDIPDIVLGNDFLSRQECVLNYGDRSLRIGGWNGTKVDFIPDREIPLKFRCKKLAASV